MLRQASRLLLPRGALCQALSSQQQLLQHATHPWDQQQTRSKSDAPDVPSAPAADTASFVHDPLDGYGSAAEVISQADVLVSASEAASDAVVLAAQAASWPGTRAFIDVLMMTHESMGLPWFEAIALSNLVIKLALMPLTVITQKEAPKMAAMRAEAEGLQKINLQMSQAKSAGEYEKLYHEYTEKMAEFKRRNKGGMVKSLLIPAMGIAQAALFISQFSAVQMLAKDKLPAMTHEGALWFTDLTMPDPFYGLPIICSIATLAMVRSGSFSDAMGQMPGGNAGMMKKMMTGVAFIMIPAGGYASSAVALLWASNALISAGQNMLLAHPGVRRLLGLPIKGVVQQPKSAEEGGSWIEQLGPQLENLNPFGQKKQARRPAAAAGAALPPPPGTRVAVNYLPHKPRRKAKSS
ncbi:hypothetical protein OEZ86_006566 [Tetradesmus obliquus]|uniref:Membrane insertase YidC/Oxa/ALB C-terminal domain-containing protein n=1 Tax=Tetradesmus obliquus TaxID=3088 RepID=A0ABY8TYG8_TETOB|nr:hypothetical protein OEZ85_006880 [Tetradesmus obliquus]WIA33434.1 hypothetical protein OEZ86_006566 [Tetradesmus obliquus]